MTILAVDVGGTNVKAGIVRSGAVTHNATLDAQGAKGAEQMMARLAPFLRDLLATAAVRDCAGVGLALPTLVDSRNTRVLADMVGKFEGMKIFDVLGWAKQELSLPVKIENDAHAALLGEWRFGAGRGASDLVMLTLGTGIGVSVILGGKPLRGTHSQTGNLGGHIVMQPDGPACSCGGRGCAESLHYVSTIMQVARTDERFASSALAKVDEITYEQLFEFAKHDALSEHMVERSIDIWGALGISLVHAFDPTRLIYGGGVMKSREAILPGLRERLKRACTPWGSVDVVASELGNTAALLGIASLFEHPPEFI